MTMIVMQGVQQADGPGVGQDGQPRIHFEGEVLPLQEQQRYRTQIAKLPLLPRWHRDVL